MSRAKEAGERRRAALEQKARNANPVYRRRRLAIWTAVALLLGGGAFVLAQSMPPPTAPRDDQGRYVVHLTGDNTFSPKDITIPVNSTVLWINDGGVHDVSGAGWSSDNELGRKLQTGESIQHTFTEPGEIQMICFVHHGIGMAMTITVR